MAVSIGGDFTLPTPGAEDTLYSFSYFNLKISAGESYTTDAFQITTVPNGTLYYNTGTATEPVLVAITDFTNVQLRINGLYIDNVKVSGIDSKLYWMPDEGEVGITEAFTVNAVDNVDGIFGNGNDETATDQGADGATVSINVVDIVLPPEITSDGGGDTASLSYDENTATTVAVTTVTADIGDGAGPIVYSIVNIGDGALFNIDSATGELTFKSSPNYEDRQDADSNNIYDVTVQADDGTSTDTQIISVTVDNINDEPVGPDTLPDQVALENEPFIYTFDVDTFTDEDAGDTLTYTAVVVTGTDPLTTEPLPEWLTFNPNTRTFSGQAADADTGTITIRVIADDGNGPNETFADFDLQVKDQNNAPVITSDGGGSTAAISIAENTTAVTTVTADDADAGDTLSYSISGGDDAALFSIDSKTGELTFDSAPDYEDPGDTGGDNVYNVEVMVSDGIATDVQTIDVTVTDANEPPVIEDGGTKVDDSTKAETVVYDVNDDNTGKDVDIDGDAITYSITKGNEDGLFEIDSATGEISIATGQALDYDQATQHTLTVQASSTGGTDTATVTIDVTDTTDPAAPTGLDLASSDDLGESNSDDLTNQTTNLTISGAGEAGATVELFDDLDSDGEIDAGESLGTTTADSKGNWSLDISLAEGEHDVKAIQTDAAGNDSDASAALTITIDTTADAAPASLDLDATDDSGIDDADDLTNQTTDLTITGTGATDSVVTLFDDVNDNGVLDTGESLGTTTVVGGKWSIDVDLAEGEHDLRAVQGDPAGNVSDASAALTVTVDTTAPTISIDGKLADDDVVNASEDDSFVVTGTSDAEDGQTVTVTISDGINADIVTKATVSSGTWTTGGDDISGLNEGTITITADVDDAAGNSATQASTTVEHDSTAPAQPSVTGITFDNGHSLGGGLGQESDGITNDTTLTVSGTAEANSTVELYIDGKATGVTATTDGSGNFTIDNTGNPFAEGDYALSVVATDAAGNDSIASADYDITIDTTPDAAPSAPDLAAADDTTVDSDNITSTNTDLTFTGAGVDGSLVMLFDDADGDGKYDAGEELSVSDIVSGGTWSIDLAGPLSDGEYDIGAIQIDEAGNQSEASSITTVTVDTQASVTITTPIAGDNVINASEESAVTVSGVSSNIEAGRSVTVSISDGNDSASAVATVQADGSWTTTVNVAANDQIDEGALTVTATAFDVAGNKGSDSVSATLDTTADAAPAGLDLAAADDTGDSDTDNVTSQTTDLTISGTGVTDSTVTLFDDKNDDGVVDAGEAIDTATVTGGAWSMDVDLAEGSYNLKAVQTDPAGNVSDASAALTVEVDTSAPAQPSITGISDDTGSAADDGITSDNTLSVTGTAEPDSTVELYVDGKATGVTATATGGNFTIDYTGTTLSDGAYALSVVATDDAGNDSKASADYNITVDSDADEVPTAAVVINDGDSYINADEDGNVSYTVSGVDTDATADITFTSSGGGTATATNVGNGTFSINLGGLGDGTITASIDVEDTAGNTDSGTGDTSTKDATAPTVDSIVVADDALAAGETSLVTITFSEAVSGLTTADFTVDNGALSSIATADGGTTWTATLTPTADLEDTSNVITLDNTGVTDAAGNAGTGTTDSNNYEIDTLRPTATIVVADDALAAGETSLVTITFNEAVSDFSNADLTIDNGTLTAVSSSDGGTTWTATLTPTADLEDTSNVITLDNTGVTDAAGNAGTGTTDSNNYEIDTLRPTATIVVADDALAAGETSLVTITFNEAVSDFSNADLTIDNGTLTAVSSSDGGTTWTATLTPTADLEDTSNVITLDNTGVTDAAGNAGTGTTDSNNYEIDTLRPTVDSIVVADDALAAGETSLVTITFSEAVSGLTTADFTVDNGALSSIATADGGTTWTATLTPTADLEDTSNVITLDNTGVTDAAGNAGTGTTDSNNYEIDTLRPTATIVVADDALAAGETSLVTITFNEAVSDFSNADLTIDNGTLTAVSSSDGGTTWTATLTPTADLEDTSNVITLDNTGVTDAAGNAGTGTTDSNNYEIDTLRPTVDSIVVADDALAAGETSLVTITFSEAVSGLTTADFTVDNGALSSIATADGGTTWTATLTPTADLEDTSNVITLDNTGVTDAAGNAGTGTTDSNNYEIDTLRPTATIVVADDALAAGETSLVTITFNEAVSDFSNADLTIDNGTLTAVSSSDGGTTWTATLTPTADLEDTSNVITLDNTGVTDAAGNAGTGTTDSNNYEIDTLRPTATIVVADDALAAGETSLVTITFNEAVSDFSNADLTIDNGTLTAVSSSDGGTTWTATLTPTADLEDTSNVITLDNTGVTDAAGNAGTGTTDSNNYEIDTLRPTATIVVADDALAAGETSLVTITFNEAVSDFSNADLTIDNGTLTAVSSSDGGTTWTATLTPTADLEDTSNVITLDNTGVTDAAGNAGTGTTDSNNYEIDTLRPTATIVVADDALAAGETSLVTITFNEAVSDFSNADLTIDNGTLTAVSSSDGGTTWTATLTPTADLEDTSNVITLDNTGVTDAAGNAGTGTTDSNNYEIDTLRPTATIVVADDALAAGETSLVTITFNEAVSDFSNADLTIDNGTLTAVSSSDGGTTWTATLTPTADLEDTSNVITLDNTGVTDAAGNAGTGTTDSNNYEIDTLRPTATIVVADDALAAGETSLVTITFNEAVSDFSNADLTIDNGTLTAVSSSDGGTTWTATLTPTADLEDTSNVITLDNTGVTDAAGNAGTGTTDSNNYEIDTLRPTATIVVADDALAAGETSLVTITFNEAVSDFSNADLTIDNGTLTAVSSSDGGTTWTATLTPTADLEDTSNVITLDNTGVTDAAGNAGTGTTDSNNYEIDTLRPTATIVVADDALAAGETSLVTITFNEAVSDFSNADLTIDNGTLTAVSSSDGGTTWTATLTPTADLEDTSNVITLDNTGVTDAAGNAGTGTTDSNNYEIDTLRPTATIVVADDALAAGETSLVTITFNEAVSDFSNADLTIDNGTLTAVSSSDGGTTWTATLTPTADLEDTSNVITLDNTGVTDAAGNAGTGTTDSNNYEIDTLRPTATIVVADDALAAGETSLVTITFNEAVSDFSNADLTIDNGTLTAVSSSDGGTTWTATLTPTADLEDTSNVITLDNTGVTDAAGNAGTGTTDSNNYEIDTLRPTVDSIVVADDALAAGETSLVTITFSEAVSGLTTADFTVDNGALSSIATADGGTTWTATLTPTADLEDTSNVITLDNTGVTDAAGNAGTGTTDSNNYEIDTLRPTATIVVADDALAAGETSLVTITFNEAVSDFSNADLTIDNGTLTAVSSSDGGTTWTATLTPTADLEDTSNVITLDNTGVTDAAGNAGTGTTDSNNYEIDTLRPTATIVVADDALAAGETSLVTITFNEAVSDFSNADLTIDNGTLTAVSSSDGGTTWTATLTPTADLEDTSNVITLDNTGVTDAAGNAGTGTTDSNNYEIDTLRPTVDSIVVADDALAAGETSLVTITFSEAVSGLTTADFTVDNGALSSIATADGGTTWTATLTPTADLEDTSNVITLDNTGVTDAAGNAGTGTTDSNNYEIDTLRPTATIVVADDALAAGETSLVTITFNEAVSDFSNADLTIDNGTLTAVSSSDGGTTWTATLTPTADLEDTSNVITLDNTGVTDAAGNAGTGTTDSNNYEIDTLRPTATIVVADDALAAGETSLVTITFNEAVSDFSNADLTIDNGTLTAVSSSDGGTTWTATLTPTADLEDTSNVITLDNTGVTDAAGNAGTGTTDSNNYEIDTLRPTATIVVADDALAAGETSLVTITFNEAVSDFSNADLTIDNGTLTAVSSSDGGTTWTATLTPTADLEDTSNVITLDNTGVTDAAGNAGTGTTDSNNYEIDTLRPTATIVVADDALAAGETSLVTITFNEAVSDFSNADLTIDNGTLTAVSSSDGGTTWTATLTPTADLEDTSNVITLDNTGVTDAAGNAGTGTTDSNNYEIDTLRPTVDSIVVADDALAAGETSLVTITFSEAVSGLTTADFTVDNGALSSIATADGGTTWTATLTPTADLEDTSNVITLDNTGVTDAAGNAGTGTTDSNNYEIDTLRPTATIVVADDALAAGETSLVTITFNEAVSDFSNADLTIDNGTLTAVSSSDGGTTWTATLTPTADLEDTSNVITLDNTGVTDAAGNAGTGTTDSNNYEIDTLRPTATIVVADDALAAGETSLVTITFNEAVSDFSNADLTIDNGTLTAVSSSDGGTTWTATLTPTADLEDTSNVITLDNTGVTDAAGNAGTGTTDSNNYEIDTLRPTATIVVADDALAAGETSLVTITFNEAVSDFSNADLTIDNGTLTAVSSSDGGTTWTATLTPTADLEDTSNVITLDNTGVTDAAGNAGTGTTDSNNYEIDTLRPTATIVVADDALAAGETSLVTITFNEAVSDFSNADLTIDNGTLTAVSSSDGGTTWTATLTPTADLEDTSNVITLDNTGVTDAAGNAGTGTTDSNNYEIDTLRPTATIVVADDALAAGETSLVTITFNEAVSDFSNADLTIDNGTLTAVSSSDGGTTWTATLTPTADLEDTSNVITLDNTGVTDAAGNAGTGTTDSNNYEIDTLRPTATIVVADDALAAGETSLVTITFNEAVSDFSNADLTIDNGTLTAVSSSDGGTTWTATLTPTADLEDTSNVITLDNTGVTDAAGNAGTGTTDSNNYEIDTLRPTITTFSSSTSDGYYNEGDTINITATVSEDIQSGDQITVTLDTGDNVVLTAGSAGTELTGTYTIGVGDTSSDLTVSSFTADDVTDDAGNVMTSTALPVSNIDDTSDIVVDTTAPTTTFDRGFYDAGSDTLTLTGSNMLTLLSTGESVGDNIKGNLDWSKLVWDSNGDDGVTDNATFVEGDITSATVLDDNTLQIVLADGNQIEGEDGYGTDAVDTLDIAQGFSVDAAGNVATTDALSDGTILSEDNAPDFAHPYWFSSADTANVKDGLDGGDEGLTVADFDATRGDTLMFVGYTATQIDGGEVTGGNTELTIDGATITLSGYTDDLDGTVVTFDDGSLLKTNTGQSGSLYGGIKGDLLLAGDSGDTLVGYAGNDYLVGGDGNDTIIAGSGLDAITGGDGSDYIVLGSDSDVDMLYYTHATGGDDDDGTDFVSGFEAGDGNDTIHFADLTQTQVDSLITVSQSGSDTLVNLGNGETIRLLGVNSGDMTSYNLVGDVPEIV